MTDATTQQPLIELKHVDKHFGSLHVLRDINLSIAPGEVVEWSEAPDAHEGSATVNVQGCDPETGAPSGNPQSVAVTIVEADSGGSQ